MTDLFPAKQRSETSKRKVSQNTAQKTFVRADVAPDPNNRNSIKVFSQKHMTSIFRRNNTRRIVREISKHCHIIPSLHQAYGSFTNTHRGSSFFWRIIGSDKEYVGHFFYLLSKRTAEVGCCTPLLFFVFS